MSQITISSTVLTKEFEGLVWKYANAVEGDNNDKAVHNIKADSVNDALDSFLNNYNVSKHINEIVSMMNDFGSLFTTSGTDYVITFDTRTRWAGSVTTLASLVKDYILDGMMVDWLNVTAPSEAAIYVARLPQDKENIIVELYKKKAPL